MEPENIIQLKSAGSVHETIEKKCEKLRKNEP